jgi:hypothetical protein
MSGEGAKQAGDPEMRELEVQPHRGSGKVSLSKHLDPGKGGEATGIVCRFVRREPALDGAREGHLRVELLTPAELVCSLVMGYHSENEELPGQPAFGSKEIQLTLKGLRDKFQRGEYEKDDSGDMAELLHAWEFLCKRSDFTKLPLYRDLDDPDRGRGWDEFVRIECVEKGLRPRNKDLQELVGLLWCSKRGMTDLWADLYKNRRLLGETSCVWMKLDDAVKAGQKPSFVDVDLIIEADQYREPCGVSCEDGRTASLKRWKLASLARCIELPIARGEVDPAASAPSGGPRHDHHRMQVIDFPGARDGQKSDQGFPEEREEAEKAARAALVRGRVRCLFVQMVQFHDITSLCLVQQCEGNNDNKETVVESLRSWLDREGWPPEEATKVGAAPPLVVAFTKFDLLEKDDQVRKQLSKLDAYAGESLNWRERWRRCRGGWDPFRDYFFTYNRRKARKQPDREWVMSLANNPDIAGLVEDCHKRLDSVCEDDGGVGDLVKYLGTRTMGESRPQRRLDALGKVLVEVARQVDQYSHFRRGAGDQDQETVERKKAEDHLAALRRSERKPHVLVDFLNTLSLRPEDVKAAYKRAATQVTEDEDDAFGALSFDDFYGQLCQSFYSRIERHRERQPRWIAALGESDAEALLGKFKELPSAAWFRDRIKQCVEPLITRADAGGAHVEAIASASSALWNRSMAWLDELPELHGGPQDDSSDGGSAPRQGAVAVPTLRTHGTAAKEFLNHWEKRLPEVYAKLVDPRQRNEQWNQDLMTIIGKLGKAVERCRKGLEEQASGSPSRPVIEKLQALEVKLAGSAQPESQQG